MSSWTEESQAFWVETLCRAQPAARVATSQTTSAAAVIEECCTQPTSIEDDFTSAAVVPASTEELAGAHMFYVSLTFLVSPVSSCSWI
jgi:hypothetical protein